MNEKLPVSWKAMVDPYNTITNLAKAEFRLKQLADPAASRKDEDIEKGAEAYAKEKIDALIEKKKAIWKEETDIPNKKKNESRHPRCSGR